MSCNKAKRPKVEDGGGGGISLAAVLAEMQDMKSKLSRMDEMQNEIDNMKGKLLQMDEMKKEITKRDDYINSKMSEMDELVSKCKYLEDKCDKLEKSVKLLVKDWKYSVPDIPDSYWEDQGFDEDYIKSIRTFLGEVKEQTLRLRSGEEMEYVSLGFDDGVGVLQHDDVLIPHWKELADALQLYQNENTFEISFNKMQLTPPIMNILAPGLKENQLKCLSFYDMEFSDAIEFAVDVIKANEHLKDINWVNSQINSKKDALDLSSAVASHPSIGSVQLENCFGVEGNIGYSALCALFAGGSEFDTIDLEGNNICTNSGKEIPEFIARNTPLKCLYLANNNLNDEDAVLIAKALKYNTNLRTLRLQRNGITNVGIDAMKKAFYDPTSLNSVSDSNHTCSLQLPGIDNFLIYNNGCDDKLVNRRLKLYHLLSARNREGSNVYHLNLELDNEDDSLVLVPKVLECIHRYSQSSELVQPLSIMYEILGSWKMPALFERREGSLSSI